MRTCVKQYKNTVIQHYTNRYILSYFSLLFFIIDMNVESIITLKQMRKELKLIETELDLLNSKQKSVIKSSIRKIKNVPFIDILEREFDLLDKQFEKYILL